MSASAGPRDRITDIAGITVGHHHRIDPDASVATFDTPGRGWACGTTVVRCPPGSVTAVDVRGGGPGTRETDLLDPANSVQYADAIVLSGGSAFGLAAADGVVAELESQGVGIALDNFGHVVPIVCGAVIFDLPVGEWSNRPDADFGRLATIAASSECELGSVGAGVGARAGELKGGVGSASVVVPVAAGVAVTVGALVVVNSHGSVVSPATGLPWGADDESVAYHHLRPPSAADRGRFAGLATKNLDLNTTIGVVATDATLTKADAKRVAMAAHDGLARAIRPAHTPVDGDTLFVVATGGQPTTASGTAAQMNTQLPLVAAVGAAAAVAVERAIVNGVLAATSVAGLPTYADILPSALGG